MQEVMVILNGKKANDNSVRSAIDEHRDMGHTIHVRVTWEHGDIQRYIEEAILLKVKKIIVGGGDGSVNEAVNGLMLIKKAQRPSLAVLPLGTANDFASACNIPATSYEAIQYALNNESRKIDIIKVNERYFANVAAIGFGAKVTSETPVQLKNFLGGGAYTLMGMFQAVNFEPYNAVIRTEYGEMSKRIIVGAVCNNKQAGGGQVLAPNAKINDGLMDSVGVSEFGPSDITQVIEEIATPSSKGQFVTILQSKWLEYESAVPIPLNLDGEPLNTTKVRFEVHQNEVSMILSPSCPVLG